MQEMQYSQNTVPGQLVIHQEPRPSHTKHKHLPKNAGAKTAGTLNENPGAHLCHLGRGKEFSPTKTVSPGRKPRLSDFATNKNFCVLRDALKISERQGIDRDKLFANHISDKRWIQNV